MACMPRPVVSRRDDGQAREAVQERTTGCIHIAFLLSQQWFPITGLHE